MPRENFVAIVLLTEETHELLISDTLKFPKIESEYNIVQVVSRIFRRGLVKPEYILYLSSYVKVLALDDKRVPDLLQMTIVVDGVCVEALAEILNLSHDNPFALNQFLWGCHCVVVDD